MAGQGPEWFWSKVTKTDNCWLWTGYTNEDGYGIFGIGGKLVKVHRYAYELLVGPIPEGYEVDHVKARGCTSRACTWPEHLEAVTHEENMRRTRRDPAQRQRTHCLHGHEFTEENTRIDGKGTRLCRTCARERQKAYRQRQK